jgi:exosome complex exonuclease DIS3/RRP44
MRQNLDNWLEANVPVDGLDEDVLIRGRMHMNRAFDGDLVVVELLPRDQWRRASKLYVDAEEPDVEHVLKCDSVDVESNDNKSPSKNRADRVNEPRPTGRVVAIIKRNWKTYCGTIEPMTGVKDDSYLFTATDPRVPRVLLKTLQGPTLLDKRIVVSVDDWLFNEPHPRGHFVRTLDGTVGTIATESEALLLQHNVSFAPFSEPVRACLPHNWKVTPLDLEERMDLRATHRVFSIDPPGCTDIDDALHAHPLPNGNFSVGVHIADVSHFIKEGTALDREAQARGTSVYLTNKRIDMVPRELGEDVCSLNCQVDRFAFSVIWEMTPEAEIKDTVFAKTIIKSVHSFSYEEAQKRMDNKDLNDEVTLDIRRLNSLARVLRKRRMDNGALTLSSPEVKFKRDEENENPVDVEMYQLRETNALVEEFMLLANIEVAKQIAKMFPAFGLLRRHPSPRPSNFDFLKRAVGRFGFNLDVTTSKSLADSLDDINRTEDPYFNTLVRILTTRCMTPARYFASGSVTPKEFHHYGLAVPIYTHFTSPIRRYADVIVHRLLAASIGISPLTPKLNQRSIQKICDGINRKNRMAELASRESTRLFTHIFLKDRTITEQAYVTGVKQNGFSVIVPRYGIEGKVYIGSVKDAAKKFNFDEAEQVLQSLDGKTRITVFDKVTVQIRVDFTKKHLPKIIYRCMEPKLHEPFPEQSTTDTQAKAASSPAPTSANVTPAKRKADSTTPTQNKKQKNK